MLISLASAKLTVAFHLHSSPSPPFFFPPVPADGQLAASCSVTTDRKPIGFGIRLEVEDHLKTLCTICLRREATAAPKPCCAELFLLGV